MDEFESYLIMHSKKTDSLWKTFNIHVSKQMECYVHTARKWLPDTVLVISVGECQHVSTVIRVGKDVNKFQLS